MIRILAAAVAALALVPAAAQARDGDPDSSFGRRGAVTLKATAADAVGGAVKVISGNRVLAGGSAAGQFVVVRLRKTGSLDSAFGTSGQVVPALPGTSAEGVRALATFRDGRIVAAGTLKLADGTNAHRGPPPAADRGDRPELRRGPGLRARSGPRARSSARW